MKKTTTRVIAAAAVLATVLFGTSAAQAEPDGTITGTVTDRATGAPLAGACVSLMQSPELTLATKCTDSAGTYTFSVTGQSGYGIHVRARAAGRPDVWWPSAPDYLNGDPVSVDPGATARADLSMITDVGGFQGRITHADGSAAYQSEVTAVAVEGNWKARAFTDADGRYRLANLPVGSYRLGLGPLGWVPQQWVPGKTVQSDGTVFPVTAGSTTTVDDRYVSVKPPEGWQTGVVTGVVTARATGAPVAGACVAAFEEDGGSQVNESCADATGRYRIDRLSVQNRYRLRVRAPGFNEQWAKDANNYDNATPYATSGFEETVVDVALRVGGGTIRGRVTPYEGGTLPWSLSAVAKAVDGSWRGGVMAVDGEYQLDRVPAGDYRVYFYAGGRTVQYHPGKATAEEAAVVHVTDGEVTVVDERLVPAGSVEVTLVDKATGGPVSGCVRLTRSVERACTAAGANRVTFPIVWATTQGAETAEVLPAGTGHWKRWVSDIRVTSGQTTRLTVQVEPAATVTTRVVDGAGAPVGGVCVRPVAARAVATVALRQENENGAYCADASGALTIGPLPAGPVRLFVGAKAPWGAQWYTSTGGTGDRDAATRLDLVAGKVTGTPAIRLDRAGSITGTLQGINGEFIDGCGQAGADSPDLPGGATNGCTSHTGTDHTGRYTISGLGPYRWPLKYTGRWAGNTDEFAPEWSGDVTNRALAVPVQVRSGESVTAPAVKLVQDARIMTFDRGAGAPSGWSVEAYHPMTGDLVARHVGSSFGEMDALPAGPLLLRYLPGNGKPCWYVGAGATGGAGGTPRPTVLTVTPQQQLDSIRLVPGSTCLAVPAATREGPSVPR
ncbi:carboxypeptidase-like regulatory domain-containing protein [Micromonospora sp. CPCC 205711]|uniref:carboxypeptidase-like regulatory domain-containing protein n=1 Tax=Micromonospora sp. CPCC 205547 TaxID=3122400 RepID=UPI002FF0428B